MNRVLRALCLLGCLSAPPALAQEPVQPGMFRDYATMQGFIRDRLSRSDFVGLMTGLLPAESLDPDRAEAFQRNLRGYLTAPLTGLASVRSSTSPDGVREEIIALWNRDDQYLFLSLVTHPREDVMVVLIAYLDGSLEDAYGNF